MILADLCGITSAPCVCVPKLCHGTKYGQMRVASVGFAGQWHRGDGWRGAQKESEGRQDTHVSSSFANTVAPIKRWEKQKRRPEGRRM